LALSPVKCALLLITKPCNVCVEKLITEKERMGDYFIDLKRYKLTLQQFMMREK
jgi:hypothetical protein